MVFQIIMASIFTVGKIARAFTSTSGARIVANNLSVCLSNQKAFLSSQRGGKKVDPNGESYLDSRSLLLTGSNRLSLNSNLRIS